MESRGKLLFVTGLTALRFPLVLLFFAGALVQAWRPAPWLFAAAFSALILSAATDLFDGYCARRWAVVTPLGAHADPLMDKFFYLVSLPLLVFLAEHNAHLPAPGPHTHGHAIFLLVLTILFLVRDQWVTFLRSVGSLYRVSGAAHWSGKLRTSLNFPLICAIYYFEQAPASVQFIPRGALYAFESLGLAVNVASLVTYTSRYWPYLRRLASLSPGAAGAQAPEDGAAGPPRSNSES